MSCNYRKPNPDLTPSSLSQTTRGCCLKWAINPLTTAVIRAYFNAKSLISEIEQVVAKMEAAMQTGGAGITGKQEEVRRALMFP